MRNNHSGLEVLRSVIERCIIKRVGFRFRNRRRSKIGIDFFKHSVGMRHIGIIKLTREFNMYRDAFVRKKIVQICVVYGFVVRILSIEKIVLDVRGAIFVFESVING